MANSHLFRIFSTSFFVRSMAMLTLYLPFGLFTFVIIFSLHFQGSPDWNPPSLVPASRFKVRTHLSKIQYFELFHSSLRPFFSFDAISAHENFSPGMWIILRCFELQSNVNREDLPSFLIDHVFWNFSRLSPVYGLFSYLPTCLAQISS